MRATIYVGDVLNRLRELPDDSVQCVVTSPPYWGLRDYGCDGQIGLEATPREFIAKMTEVFREVRRVLRSDGTCWVNMGDGYAANRGGTTPPAETLAGGTAGVVARLAPAVRIVVPNPSRDPKNHGLKHKDMLGMPWRLAFALQDDGWWLRQDIIWSKPNPMPESVTDRCTKAHEYIFLLTKSARYFYDQDAIRTPFAEEFGRRDGYTSPTRVAGWAEGPGSHAAKDHATAKSHKGSKFHEGKQSKGNEATGERFDNTKGANKRSVWEIATEAYADAHFATFPTKLVEPCILAGTKPGDVVLDPFCGSGTTGLVAMRYQRDFVGIELNPEYARLAERRIGDEIPLFTGVEVIGLKPMAVVNG